MPNTHQPNPQPSGKKTTSWIKTASVGLAGLVGGILIALQLYTKVWSHLWRMT
jgi:hypothetical protein